MRAVTCSPAEAAVLLAGAKSAKTDRGNRFSLAEVIAEGQPYAVIAPTGETVAAYVLARLGAHLWIMAAAGRAAFDLTGAIAALVDAQGRGYTSVGFRTERRGLVRKARRHGYRVEREEDGVYFLRKNLQC